MSDVAEAWQPATELEARMHDAVRSGGGQSYFQLLAQASLVIPVPPEQAEAVLANTAQPTWPVCDVDGRVHVLAYTSPEAMHLSLGPDVRHFITMSFADIAGSWPEPSWWLAVNVGLPIQGLLPSWFVTQVADGDPLPPRVGLPRTGGMVLSEPIEEPPAAAEAAEPVTEPAAEPTIEPAAEPAADTVEPATETVPAEEPPEKHTEEPVAEHPEEHAGGELVDAAPAPDAVPEPVDAPELIDEPTDEVVDAATQTETSTEADVSVEPAPGAEAAAPPSAVEEDAAAAAAAGLVGDTVADARMDGAGTAAEDTVDDAVDTSSEVAASKTASKVAEHAAEPELLAESAHPTEPAELEPTTEPIPVTAGEPAAPLPPADVPFHPANDLEQQLLEARAAGDDEAFITALVGSEILLRVPPGTGQEAHPGRSDFPWPVSRAGGVPSITVCSSAQRLGELHGGPSAGDGALAFQFASVLRYWPEPGWTLTLNPGSVISLSLPGERLPSLAGWADQLVAQRMAEHFAPQNDVEQQLFDAAVRRDIDGFFTALLGAQVLVPAGPESPWGIRPDDPAFPWQPIPVQGELAIQLFTSLRWMHDAIGPSRFLMPTFLEVVSAWPDSSWTLILNPATPIDAAVPGERVRELAASAPPPPPAQAGEPAAAMQPPLPGAAPQSGPPQSGPAPQPDQASPPGQQSRPEPAPYPVPDSARQSQPLPDFQPGNGTDQELYETARLGDTDAFLRVLLRSSVLVPIPAGTTPEIPPGDPRFRWEAALKDPTSVQVFTSHARLQDALNAGGLDPAATGSRGAVSIGFYDLIGCWPHAEWTMLVNPGTRIGASLRGDQVQALSAWAHRVGLVTQAQPVQPEHPAQPVQHAQPAQPAQHAEPPLQHAESEPQAWRQLQPQPAPVPAAPTRQPAPATEPYPGPDPTSPPATATAAATARPRIMQKALPPEHVGWYLEQGYDRISGFVHAADDVAELQTPLQLYETLGLLHPGSPFSAGDEGVYVIRWPAYCADLYRIPFGGQTEDELRRWGDAGWVVEPAPFRGDGFAPGSAGTIREFKVNSIRLPFGAEMYYLGRDRSERFIARYDPDRLAWLRPEESEASAQVGPADPQGQRGPYGSYSSYGTPGPHESREPHHPNHPSQPGHPKQPHEQHQQPGMTR